MVASSSLDHISYSLPEWDTDELRLPSTGQSAPTTGQETCNVRSLIIIAFGLHISRIGNFISPSNLVIRSPVFLLSGRFE
jgi:hypothetical protein